MTCNKVRRPVKIEIKTCSNICACHDDRLSRAKLYPKETGIIFNKSGIIYQRNSSHIQEKNSVRSLLTSLRFLGLCALTIRTADVLKNSRLDKTARSRRQSSVWVFHALTVEETVSLLSAFQNAQQLACPILAPSTTSPPPTQPHRKDQGPFHRSAAPALVLQSQTYAPTSCTAVAVPLHWPQSANHSSVPLLQ